MNANITNVKRKYHKCKCQIYERQKYMSNIYNNCHKCKRQIYECQLNKSNIYNTYEDIHVKYVSAK